MYGFMLSVSNRYVAPSLNASIRVGEQRSEPHLLGIEENEDGLLEVSLDENYKLSEVG